MKTLLLNKTYEPLFVTTARRAFCMVLLGKAEVLSNYEESFVSVNGDYPKPAVIRLTDRRIAFSPKKARCTRKAVFARDGYMCGYCGDLLRSKQLTWDHIKPKSRGGRKSWNNMVTCCQPCNTLKADRTPEEAGMPLLWKPERPSLFDEKVHPKWEPWLFI